MKLLLVRHFWGVDLTHGLDSLLAHWHATGYEAVECSPFRFRDVQGLRQILKNEGLPWIPQIFSGELAGGGTVSEHISTLRERTDSCLDSEPLFFNVQGGSDAWTLDEAEEFYLELREIEARSGIVLSHETHRSRYFGNPWNTYRLLERVPDVRLTCDFSHWVCAAERLLTDADDVFRRVVRNCHHIHARVGYEQGPQVPDPRDPQWSSHLQAHERWWEMVWWAQQSQSREVTTLTPEFGPPPYMHTLPFSQQPVVELEAICDWMARRQADHFRSWSLQNAAG